MPEDNHTPVFAEMQTCHQAEVEALIISAMNENEGRWVRQTFDFHFDCLEKGIDSSRQFYIALLDSTIVGIIGLHHSRWGPDENVWLSWFAVRPDYQGQGIGKWLMTNIQKTALDQGYRKLFVETYREATFHRAIGFYQQQGFQQVGSIAQFLPDGSDMLVFARNLD